VSTTIAKNVKESILDKEDLIPGDMVFFSTFNKKYINHVGVYLGEGKFIHASIKYGVIVSSLAEGYYSKTWRKGGRN
jgi:cell wall-associated NlpC family hydrolase